jgi:hypothetical protein
VHATIQEDNSSGEREGGSVFFLFGNLLMQDARRKSQNTHGHEMRLVLCGSPVKA